MRLCIVNEFFYPDMTGGTGTVLSDLARGLRTAHPDLEIEVVTSHHRYRGDEAHLPAYEEWEGIRIFRLPTPHPNRGGNARRLVVNAHFGLAALGHLLRRPRYDVVLTSTAPPPAALTAHLYRRLTGTPYVYIVYDLEPDRVVALGVLPTGHPAVRMVRICQRRWLSDAARVVVLGRCMRDYVARVHRVSQGRMAVIPTGTDSDAVTPLPRATRFRVRHGLTGFVVCYTGNFGRYHDFDAILNAAALLRGRTPGFTFALVGNGSQRARIEARVAAERLDNVRLFPFVPSEEYADLLASADASLVTLEAGMEGLCVPSKFYSILASGRPTLAMVSSGSEVARVIAEADCGVRVDQGDAAGLAEVISRIAGDPAAAAAMGDRARAVLVARYSAAHTAEAYYRLLQEVVPKTPRSQEAQTRFSLRPAPGEQSRPTLSNGVNQKRADPPAVGVPIAKNINCRE